MAGKPHKRIVIIGAASTGKTTLAEAISKKLNLKLIQEQARIICKRLGSNNIYEIKDQKQFRFQVLKDQIKLEERLKNFISDRSTIDCWVHWIRWNYETAKTFESEKYYKLAFSQALKYSKIIYVPRIIKPKNDGFRWNDNDYQNQIDRLFKDILFEWNLIQRTYIIQSSKLNERVKEAMNFI